MPEKQKSTSLKRVFIIYILSSILIIVGVFFWSLSQQATLKAELELGQEKLRLVELDNEAYNAMQQLDAYFLEGDKTQAVKGYDSLLATNYLPVSIQLSIEKRKAFIDSFSESMNRDTTNDVYLEQRLRLTLTELDSLEKQIETLELENNKAVLSREMTLAQMQKTLKEKDRALQKKNNVQVISFKNENGDVIHYLGNVENEMANGGGIGIWNTGSLYKGDWKDNQRHGKGEFTWSDGHKYKGEFEKDVRQGNGIYYWPSGEKYEGQWSDGKRNGQGTLYDKDGNIQYDGMWKKDKIVNE